jgi:DNA polymerase
MTTTLLNTIDKPIIKGIGPKDAKIAIFGEAPGAEEEQYGKPFIGKAGRLLTNILNEVGLPRDTLYIDNVVPIRPPGNKLDRLGEYGVTAEHFYNGARKRLREINPDVCILLGNVPLGCFLGFDNITKRRGSVYMWEGIKMIPSLHPSGILRGNHQGLYLLEFDIRKAKGLVGNPTPHKDRTYIIDPNFDQVMEGLERLMDAQFLSVDIETVRYNTIDCFGLGDSDDWVLCIPFLTRSGPRWSQADEKEIWKKIIQVMERPSLKIIQNAMYELFFFHFYGIPIKNLWMDTMLAIHTLYPEFKKALWNIQSLYTNEPYHKDEGREADSDADRWVYNCKDVAVTFESAMGLFEDLQLAGLDHFFFNHVMRVLKPYIAMSTRGVRVNTQKLEYLKRETEKEREYHQSILDGKVGEPLNVKSFKKMKEYFYIKKNLKPISKGGKITLNEDALWQLSAKYPQVTELQDVIRIRNRRTFQELFLSKEMDWDGRMRFGFNPAGTVTGRSSSSTCPFGTGLNIQQTPRPDGIPRIWKEFREIFVSEPGYVFVAADLSQAEARVVTWICNDRIEKEMYHEGKSVHIRNASICTDQDPSLCEKGTEAYNLGKASKHAYNYAIGPIQLFREIVKNYGRAERELPPNFGVALCKRILARFDRGAPLIKEVFHQYIKHEIKRGRTLYSPFGRRRVLMEQWGEPLFRSGYSTLPQSTVVDTVSRAMYLIEDERPEDVFWVEQKHDSLTMQCPDEKVEETKALMKEHMETSIIINGDEMIIPVEFKVGVNLGEV